MTRNGAIRRSEYVRGARNVVISFEFVFALFLFTGAVNRFVEYELVGQNLLSLAVFGIAVLTYAYLVLIAHGSISRTGVWISVIGLVFFGYIVLSNVWSPSTDYALSKTLRSVMIVFSIVAPATLIGQTERRLHRFLFSIVVISAFSAIVSVFMFAGVIDAVYDNRLTIARLIGFGLIAVGYFAIFTDRLGEKVVIALGAAFLLVLLFNGSRGPLATMLIALGILAGAGLLLGQFSLHARTIPLAGGALALFAAGFGALTWYLPATPQTIERFRRFTTDFSDSSLDGRLEHYEAAIQVWASAPVFGHGIGSYPLVIGGSDAQNYPHNFVLEILAELGIVGGLLVGAMIVFGAVRLRRLFAHNPAISVLIGTIFMYFLLAAMFSFDITGNRHVFAAIGFAFGAYRGEGETEEDSSTVAVRLGRWDNDSSNNVEDNA